MSQGADEMLQASDEAEWLRMSWLLSLIANVNRNPKSRSTPFKPEEFNPYRVPKSRGLPLTAEFIRKQAELDRARKAKENR